jgi:uncharacterized RDD family membrane protein YckC
MTGLMNTATPGDPAVPAHLCDPGAPDVEAILTPLPTDPETWRSEVAARLARYRTRRKPRAPRYPSLLLPFDSSDNWSRPSSMPASLPPAMPPDHDFPFSQPELRGADSLASFSSQFAALQPPPEALEPEPFANVIEFPRSAAIPVLHASLLADPIFDRPRIVEAPEVVPPPPALGGMLIEPVQPMPADPRSGIDSRLQSSSIPRRLLATAVDSLILAVALSAFAAIFLRFNPVRGPLSVFAGTIAALAALLWMAYQFLFIVYTGSTPGLSAAHLELAKFDGLPLTRRVRRWRVLASFLSAFSAGLGYLWCFLDQDSLTWHDRITRTYLQSTVSR